VGIVNRKTKAKVDGSARRDNQFTFGKLGKTATLSVGNKINPGTHSRSWRTRQLAVRFCSNFRPALWLFLPPLSLASDAFHDR